MSDDVIPSASIYNFRLTTTDCAVTLAYICKEVLLFGFNF